MKKFLKLVSVSLQGKLYYRFGLFSSLLSPIILLLGQFLLWDSLYGLQNDNDISGLSKKYMFSYILISCALNYLLTWSSESDLSRDIISGAIVSRCVRPAFFITQTISGIVGSMIPFLLSNSLIVVVAFLLFGNTFLIPPLINWLIFIPCFLLSTVLRILLVEVFSLLCFFTTSHLGLSWTRKAIYEFFSGALIPVAFFPVLLQNITNATPFPYMLNVPISILLGGELPFSFPVVILIQMIWIGVFVLLHNVFYGKISKNLTIAGG